MAISDAALASSSSLRRSSSYPSASKVGAAYLSRVEIDALDTLAPGTSHVSVVSISLRARCPGLGASRSVRTRAASVRAKGSC